METKIDYILEIKAEISTHTDNPRMDLEKRWPVMFL